MFLFKVDVRSYFPGVASSDLEVTNRLKLLQAQQPPIVKRLAATQVRKMVAGSSFNN